MKPSEINIELLTEVLAALPDGVNVYSVTSYGSRWRIQVEDCRPCGEVTQRWVGGQYPVEVTATVCGCDVFSRHNAKTAVAPVEYEIA